MPDSRRAWEREPTHLRKIYEEFSGRVAEFGNKLKVGNSLDPDTQIGPLVSSEQLDRVTGYLSIGR